MSEERPVPRRESPWGLPEGDTRQPKAHRCNDRAEDVVQVRSLSSHFSYVATSGLPIVLMNKDCHSSLVITI
jgi:hypothetical protein